MDKYLLKENLSAKNNTYNNSSSLANSALMRFVSKYLTISIRLGAYAANFYTLSLINSSGVLASSMLK